jgi:alpha-ketoglutarate-dependent taurine dioxygenase
MPRTADFVGLLCVRAAAEGGDSKFVSVASVHNTLLRHAPTLLRTLYRPFYFDRRIANAQVTPNNPALLLEPIFSYDPTLEARGLRLRWQPEYVWDAPRLPGAPALQEQQRMALHLLEGVLEDRSGALTIRLSMHPGDIQLVNNHAVAHGRTAFSDDRRANGSSVSAPRGGRLMRRVWMHGHL